jgi:hypothetical protein
MSATVQRAPLSPALPPKPGIVVAVDRSRDPRAPLVLHGAFHLPILEGDAIGHPVHRAIVVVAWSFGTKWATAPFRELVLFADDELGLPGGVGGYFNVDLFALQERPIAGDFHLLSSIGGWISNVERASVR